MGNITAYDVKSCQVKMTIVNCTEVRLKGIKISTYHKRDVGIANNYATQKENFKWYAIT